MSKIRCTECGCTVDGKNTVCPECGAPINKGGKTEKKSLKIIGMVAVFVVGIVVGMIFHAVAFDSKSTNIAVVDEETDKSTDDVQTSSNENDDIKDTEDQDASIKETSIGEPMNITHDYGNYILTVDAVRKCDWLERSGEENQTGKTAILLELDIKNQTYDDPYNSIMFIENQIILLDENNYSIQSHGLAYNDGEYSPSPQIPAGTNGKLVIPYIVDDSCNSVTITFNNQYRIVAEIM